MIESSKALFVEMLFRSYWRIYVCVRFDNLVGDLVERLQSLGVELVRD